MNRTNDMIEGPEALARFNSTMAHVMTVSPQELKRRIEAEHQVSALNPNRRGPKPQKKRGRRAPAV
jgi:hypothetical protein